MVKYQHFFVTEATGFRDAKRDGTHGSTGININLTHWTLGGSPFSEKCNNAI